MGMCTTRAVLFFLAGRLARPWHDMSRMRRLIPAGSIDGEAAKNAAQHRDHDATL
jgi:hypothetical protein